MPRDFVTTYSLAKFLQHACETCPCGPVNMDTTSREEIEALMSIIEDEVCVGDCNVYLMGCIFSPENFESLQKDLQKLLAKCV